MLGGEAAPLKLQDVHAGVRVRPDLRDLADLTTRKVPRVHPAPVRVEVPALLADAEAGSDASSFHAPGPAEAERRALRRLDSVGGLSPRRDGERCRGQMQEARHPALPQQNELL